MVGARLVTWRERICQQLQLSLIEYGFVIFPQYIIFGPTAKLRKATISSVIVRPHETNSARSRRIFMKYADRIFLANLSRKMSFIEIWQEYLVLYVKTYVYLWEYLAVFSLGWEIFQAKLVEKMKTHIFYSAIFFLGNRAVYEIMWKKFTEPDKPRMKAWRIRIAFWIPKATDTHSVYVIQIAFRRQQWLLERASMLRSYVHYLSCYAFNASSVMYFHICYFPSFKTGLFSYLKAAV